jgi:predicted ATPase
MLTRVEIDGFKSFEHFSIDLPPFAVVVGPNAVGKSNFFDALRLLSKLAEEDVHSAFQGLRGEPSELFRVGADGQLASRITLAAELLLDKKIYDAYGSEYNLKGVRMRYEVVIERRRSAVDAPDRLYIASEAASLIQRSDDRLFAATAASDNAASNKKALVAWAPSSNKKPELLTTHGSGPGASLEVSQDGSAGRPQKVPLGQATATFLSRVRTADQFLHLFALREAVAGIRHLHLEASRARLPSDQFDKGEMSPDGSNLAAVLARIRDETRSAERPDGVLADIRADLTDLISGTQNLEVVRNDAAKQYQAFVQMTDGSRFSSRVISDGTLRLLALLTYLHDPQRSGVLCFEEPENGIHEGQVPALINLLRGFCSDLSGAPEVGTKLSQIIVNSHSPRVLSSLKRHEVIAADTMVSRDGEGNVRRRTRMRRGVADQLPILSAEEREHNLTRIELDQLLRDHRRAG